MVRYMIVNKAHLKTFHRTEIFITAKAAKKQFLNNRDQFDGMTWGEVKEQGWRCKAVEIKYINC